ncbi:MAG: hypothetical protein Q9219_005068 [cf. Caloplaca sp. 3 TL-2023]
MHLRTLVSLIPFLPLILALPTTSPLHSRAANSTSTTTATTEAIPVSRAGGVLNPEAAAEANPRDDTATRAFSSVNIKSSDGRCLSVDPAAGDFRLNLIPVQLQACSDDAGQKWDIVTKGKHIDQEGAMLATQGCLNFDPRRKAGDQVIMFSCGGRADGGGAVTNSQEFAFKAGAQSQQLSPLSDAGTCLVADGAKLNSAGCSGEASQSFTIG